MATKDLPESVDLRHLCGPVVGEIPKKLPNNLNGPPTGTAEAYCSCVEGSKFFLLIKQLSALESFADLPNNWDGYGAEIPNKLALDNTSSILRLMTYLSMLASRIVASAQGGVGIYFFGRPNEADIECYNSGEIVGTLKDGHGHSTNTDLTIGQIPEYLGTIRAHLSQNE